MKENSNTIEEIKQLDFNSEEYEIDDDVITRLLELQNIISRN